MKTKSLRKKIRRSVPIRYQLVLLLLWMTSGIGNLPLGAFLVLGSCYLGVFYYVYYRLFRQAFFLTTYYAKHITKIFPEFQKVATWTPILTRCRQIAFLSFVLIELLLSFPLMLVVKEGGLVGLTFILTVIGQFQFVRIFHYFIQQQQQFEGMLTDVVKTLQN